jgi:serine/threonine protein phosphatase PrpC
LQAVDFVESKLRQGMSPKEVCEALCDRCMAPDTETDGGKGCDNMSAMVVVLKPYCEIAASETPAEEADGSTAIRSGETF